MILLDTHIWIWWVTHSSELPAREKYLIEEAIQEGIGVSMISCWEILKKVEVGKLVLKTQAPDWIRTALSYPGVQLLELSLDIMVESTQLPGEFHKDPADQMIVATSRVLDIPLVTMDQKIQAYNHVKLLR